MSAKITITKPVVILLYGYPGSGKTTFANEFAKATNLIHLYSEKVSQEFFGRPYSQNKQATDKLIIMLMELLLGAGLGVILDVDASRVKTRKAYTDIAKQLKAKSLVIWFQMDAETAYTRKSSIDRRRAENKYETSISQAEFVEKAQTMQNPVDGYVVVSGKHTFRTQKAALIKRLFGMKLIDSSQTQANIVKPGLINLVPQPSLGGSGRNISIR
jgi:predicted kinase